MAEYMSEEAVQFERVEYDWVIPNFFNQIAQLNSDSHCWSSKFSLLSDEFMRGQHVQHTSMWQMELRRYSIQMSDPSLFLFLHLRNNYQTQNGTFIWTKYNVHIINSEGKIVRSEIEDSNFYGEHESCIQNYEYNMYSFVNRCGCRKYYNNDLAGGKLISFSDLYKNWDNLVERDILVLRLQLYIFRERPLANQADELTRNLNSLPSPQVEFMELLREHFKKHFHMSLSGICISLWRRWVSWRNYDVVFRVDGCRERLNAHTFVVSGQSSVIKRFLEENPIREGLKEHKIFVSGVSYPVFQIILKYMYSVELNELTQSQDVIFLENVLKTCLILEMNPLASLCYSKLIDNLNIDNFPDTAFLIYSTARGQDRIFKKEIKQFFNRNLSLLQQSNDFKRKAMANRDLFLKLNFDPEPENYYDEDLNGSIEYGINLQILVDHGDNGEEDQMNEEG